MARALALDDGLSEAYASLGLLRLNQGELSAAELALRAAVDLNRNNSMAHMWLGLALLRTTGPRAALAEYERALASDVLHPVINYNVAVTRRAVDMAHACGVSVEGELGCLGSLETGEAGEEDGIGAEGKLTHDQLLTDPEEAARFVADTDVDALAIACGTSHGAYKFSRPPTGDILAIGRIKEINERIPNTHLVMHGSSSVPQDWLAIINEYGGEIPADLAGKVGGRFFGCDACVAACPYSEAGPVGGNGDFRFYSERERVRLERILRLEEGQFAEEFGDSPMRRAGVPAGWFTVGGFRGGRRRRGNRRRSR